ncbi:MAG: hypothetical protein IIA50_05775, partial [Bacteroidetes bacterium]|nr:hypothetical protein [Bacteroidota bacterium]
MLPPDGSGAVVCSIKEAVQRFPELIDRHLGRYADHKSESFPALNTAFLKDGLFIYLRTATKLDQPLYITDVLQENGSIFHQPRLLVIADKGSQASIVQICEGTASATSFENAVAEIYLASEAVIDYHHVFDRGDEAQIVETYLLNQVTLQTTLASKAARVVSAVRGRTVVDFAARRTHGTDAANKLARASYMAGFAGTSNVLAAARHGIPPVGTMAHSFISSFPAEIDAFRAYADSFPDTTTLLVDTYDTAVGTRHAIEVAKELRASGHAVRALRLDSGDLLALSVECRRMLDDAGLQDVELFASGGLDVL